jgi:hypothetical protein
MQNQGSIIANNNNGNNNNDDDDNDNNPINNNSHDQTIKPVLILRSGLIICVDLMS